MSDFLESDVIALAKAVLEDPINYMDSDYSPFYWCVYCGIEQHDMSSSAELEHDLDCPVLIAQDVLTGHREA